MHHLRLLTAADLPRVLAIQSEAYTAAFLEPEETFAAKLRLFPSGCCAALRAGLIEGYLFSHPWRGSEPVPLAIATLTLPAQPDCYYIHDLAVANSARGSGVGKLLVRHALSIAGRMKLRRTLLVAVQDSQRFWAHYGFVALQELTYAGQPAALMQRTEG